MKTIITILFTVVFFVNVFAQTTPPPKQWDKRFGGTGNNELFSLQQTKDGGYILGGSSDSNIGDDKTQDSKGDYDYWVVKIDANGIKKWDKTFGGNDKDILTSLQQTTDGGYILGGYSFSGFGGDKTEDNRGLAYSSDYWVVKIDANGNKQWDKRFGGNGNDKLQSIKQTNDGGYILGGYSASEIGGDKSEASRGFSDYWVVKIDANGIKKWDKRFGGADIEELYSLQQTTDGGYILGGYSMSGIDGDKTEESRGVFDYWIVKIDSNGIKEWDKRFGGSYDDYLFSLQQTNDGGYILGGCSTSDIGGDKTESRRGLIDYWIVKIDANGAKQWDKRFGGVDVDQLLSIQQTMDNGYILGGYSVSGIGGDKTQASRGGWDYWIVKIDANGIKLWDKRFSGSGNCQEFNDCDDYLHSLQQTTDGGYILGGSSRSLIGGDKTQESVGFVNYWILKLGCPPQAQIINKGNLDICATGSVLLKINTTDTLKYQWLKNNKKIPGATNWYYTATAPGTYKVVVYTNASCKNISNALIVTKSCGPVSASQLSSVNNQLQTINSKLQTSLIPNPTSGNTTLSISNAVGNVQVSVYDMVGKLVTSYSPFKGQSIIKLGVSDLSPGSYLVRVKDEQEEVVIKFIKE